MSLSRSSALLVLLLVVGLAACSGGRTAPQPTAQMPAPTPAAPMAPAPTYAPPPTTYTPPPTTPMPAAPTATASPAVQAQIDRGVTLFAQHCAACHGSRGEGSRSAPGLIGEGTLPLDPPPGARLRRVRFQSAMDLGMFIKTNMPPNGNHLPPRDVACVLAYLLQQHGRTPTQPISPATAGAITR